LSRIVGSVWRRCAMNFSVSEWLLLLLITIILLLFSIPAEELV
jgi:hypothetical protein